MVFYMESLKNKRSGNEDSYCHMDIRMNHEATVSAFVVADGMGGLEQGKKYSEHAISYWFEALVGLIMGESFRDCSLQNQIDCLREFSQDVFHQINKKLYVEGLDAGIRGGTTLSAALHFWDTWIFANCGDSPIYVLSEDKLNICSEIQNVAWQLVREEKTQVGSTVFHQNKNRLLEFLGRKDTVHPHVTAMTDSQVEAVLMGSDGAFGDLSLGKMEKMILHQYGDSKLLGQLLEKVRDTGESDNQTAILIFNPQNKMDHEEETEVETLCGEPMEPIYRQVEEEKSGGWLNRFFRRGGDERK